jgi:hypothetical protein
MFLRGATTMSFRRYLPGFPQFLRVGQRARRLQKVHRRLLLEPLEDRWSTEEIRAITSLRFGANADLARRVVDAAIGAWSPVPQPRRQLSTVPACP